jgi:Lrp/AsnC family leucine-responsive transcriptional regulator
MADTPRLDDIDYQILDLLRRNARRTLRDIADHVNLTVAPVKRRVQRLEALGVIDGYTVRINRSRVSAGLEAMTELRFAGNLDLEDIVKIAGKIAEVEEILTIAGDQDALVRIRADNVEHLQRIVNRLRTEGDSVMSTKTLVILGSWVRAE